MKALLLTLCLSLPAVAAQRSAAEMMAFKRSVPCPATGKPELRCVGFEVDHLKSLCSGGDDKKQNMQWLSIEAHRAKTKIDVRECRRKREQKKNQSVIGNP